jgi:hypothetical protein
MQRSENLNELAIALSKAQADMKAAIFDRENAYFKDAKGKPSRYASLVAVWDAARGPLTKNGFCIIQSVDHVGESPVLNTTLLHSSGQWVGSQVVLKPEKLNAQSLASAVTYAKRMAMAALCGIVADEDDDGNEASGIGMKPKGGHAPPSLGRMVSGGPLVGNKVSGTSAGESRDVPKIQVVPELNPFIQHKPEVKKEVESFEDFEAPLISEDLEGYIPPTGKLAGIPLRQKSDDELKSYFKDTMLAIAQSGKTFEQHSRERQEILNTIEKVLKGRKVF